MKHEFTCFSCKQNIIHESSFSTGYGLDNEGRKTCFRCCGIMDHERMRDEDRMILYLTDDDFVTNWPGTLRLKATVFKKKQGHNWGLTRYDAYFRDGWGNFWWGVRYGDNTEVLHCKKLKHRQDWFGHVVAKSAHNIIPHKER